MGKILFVDDSTIIRQKMEKLLKARDYLVETASNGIEGLKKIAEVDFDLVLLDVAMPEMDGFEMCQKLREKTETSLLPQVVFFSSSTERSKRVEGLKLGVSDFMVKSMAWEYPDEFYARIEAHLKISNLMRDKIELEKLGILRATAISVNHEVANPLQAISLSVNRIQNCWKDGLKADRYFDNIAKNIKRISEILKKLANAVNTTTGEYAGGDKIIDISAIVKKK